MTVLLNAGAAQKQRPRRTAHPCWVVWPWGCLGNTRTRVDVLERPTSCVEQHAGFRPALAERIPVSDAWQPPCVVSLVLMPRMGNVAGRRRSRTSRPAGLAVPTGSGVDGVEAAIGSAGAGFLLPTGSVSVLFSRGFLLVGSSRRVFRGCARPSTSPPCRRGRASGAAAGTRGRAGTSSCCTAGTGTAPSSGSTVVFAVLSAVSSSGWGSARGVLLCAFSSSWALAFFGGSVGLGFLGLTPVVRARARFTWLLGVRWSP